MRPSESDPFFRCSRLRSGALTALGVALAAALAGCAVGPDYHRPDAPLSDHYREEVPAPAAAASARALTDAGIWVPATPADTAPRGEWWRVFGDATLDRLEQQLLQGNQTLAEYEAQYRAAQALLQQAQGGLWPTLGLSGSAARSHSTPGGATASVYATGLSASWEPDLWGSVRRSIESQRGKVQASAAQLAGARLSLQAQLATAYLQLVVTDRQLAQLRQSVDTLQAMLTFTRHQLKAGVVAPDTVAQAEAQVRSQQAQWVARQLTRAQLEHAIAATLGVPPAGFALPAAHAPLTLPYIPPGLPSTLLQRRPDIAAAERTMAAANAQIGVAEAAYFPSLTLSGSSGFSGSALSGLLSAPQHVWSLGAALAASLIDGGQRRAAVANAGATYDASVAAYRQTVLSALQGVEDNLAAQRLLTEEEQQQAAAVAAARQAETVIQHQYRYGMVSYLAVLTAQNTRLTAENTLWSVRNSQYTAAVALIAALGGGWGPIAPQAESAAAQAAGAAGVPAAAASGAATMHGA